MARFSGLFDEQGGFTANPSMQPADEPQVIGNRIADLGGGDQPVVPGADAGAGAGPSADPPPGPNGNPAPQGGPPPQAQGPPPAIASSIPGLQGSEATGGVRGSFAQAGTGGFSRRFGLPAAWFKGGPTGGLAREAGNIGRGALGRDRAGAGGGGYGAEVVANAPVGPSQGSEGGGKNDEEWQRIMQAALRNRFR